jgi:hypothetical protein
LCALFQVMSGMGHPALSVELDWLLWHRGEAAKSDMPPEHRTLSVFY